VYFLILWWKLLTGASNKTYMNVCVTCRCYCLLATHLIQCHIQECVQLYLHPPYILMTWCIIKYRDICNCTLWTPIMCLLCCSDPSEQNSTFVTLTIIHEKRRTSNLNNWISTVGWFFKFRCLIQWKYEYYLNRKNIKTYELNRILWEKNERRLSLS
jgi:hypothetical protein